MGKNNLKYATNVTNINFLINNKFNLTQMENVNNVKTEREVYIETILKNTKDVIIIVQNFESFLNTLSNDELKILADESYFA